MAAMVQRDAGRGSCLAAAGAVLLRAAGQPAGAGRGARAVAGAVPRPAPHRAGPAGADGAARRDAGLRRVERHRPGRSTRIARAGAAAILSRRPAGEGAGVDTERRTRVRALLEKRLAEPPAPPPVVGGRATSPRTHPQTPPRIAGQPPVINSVNATREGGDLPSNRTRRYPSSRLPDEPRGIEDRPRASIRSRIHTSPPNCRLIRVRFLPGILLAAHQREEGL